MMNHRARLPGVAALLLMTLAACGGGGSSSDTGGNTAADMEEDSGPPMSPGEMSNAGNSTLIDGDPVVDTTGEAPTDVPADDAPAQEGLAAIAGLWDDSLTFPDGRVNITYLEITTDGRYVNHDYRGDSFDLGENCFETIEGTVRVDPGGGFRASVLNEEFTFDAIAMNGQLQVSFPQGGMTTLAAVTGLSTADFNEC